MQALSCLEGITPKTKHALSAELSALVLNTLGTFIYIAGVVLFTLPYRFPDSGAMGVAVVCKYAFGFAPSLVNLLINAALMAVGGKMLSKRFAAWSVYNVALDSFFLWLLPQFISFPRVDDMLLVAIVGGCVKGIGDGLVFRAGASGGGTDIIAAVLKNRLGVEVGRYCFYLNLLVLVASMGVVGAENTLYGIIACFVSGQATDAVLAGFDRRSMVMVVAKEAAGTADYLNKELGCRAAVTSDERGSGKTVTSFLTARQLASLKKYLAANEPDAFLAAAEASEVTGRGFRSWKNAA